MQSWLAVGSLVLVMGSWRLWVPQHDFPRVPLFAFALNWSDHADEFITWTCLSLWLLSTLLLALPKISQLTSRVAAILYASLFALLVVLDQHRLQPWGVHIAVCLLIVTAFDRRQLLSWLITFTASIYIYSALSKFDAQFLHTVGQDFLAGLLRVWPGGYSALSEQARLFGAACFPVAELMCGISLLWHRSRTIALAAAIVMHATLIGILGPWGLGHSWGVLLWNVVFIGLNVGVWLELRVEKAAGPFRLTWFSTQPSVGSLRRWRYCVASLCGMMLMLPLGERLGIVDHWLGWALYAPHSSRARIELLAGSGGRQTEVVRRFVEADQQDLSPWERVAVERWSLQGLGVPIYPQQRFYVGVALALAESTDEYGLRVTLLGTANRWTGARNQRILESRDDLQRHSACYWFNTRPRWKNGPPTIYEQSAQR